MVTELEMAKAAGKNLRVIFQNGNIVNGFCFGFTQAIDNEPEIACIDMRLSPDNKWEEYFQDEIESIEVVEG
jgi:hypothetical protein|nr:MAG TPA: hypothetical protein [Caudoviricetes sp.]